MSGMTAEKLESLVSQAVKNAMGDQPSILDGLECPGCHQKFQGIPSYVDHRVGESLDKSLKEMTDKIGAFKIPTSEEFLAECKDGLCGIIEETYDVTKKGEAPPPEPSGSFLDYEDEPEEA